MSELNRNGWSFEKVTGGNEQYRRAAHRMSDVPKCQTFNAQIVVWQRRVVVLTNRLDRVTQLMQAGAVLRQYQA